MRNYIERLLGKIVFMGVLFGILWILFILADSGNGSSLLSRAHYYFWMVLPLVVFGIVFNAIGLAVKREKAD